MSDLIQHKPFDLVDVTEPYRPTWLPEVDLPGPDWHLYESGEFPHVKDKALREPEEQP